MNLRVITAVARWEYKRFAKPRDLVLGVLFTSLMFGATSFGRSFFEGRNNRPREIAVVGAERMGLLATDSLHRFQLRSDDRDFEVLEQALEDKEFDALLAIKSSSEAELHVRSERRWQKEFITLLTAHGQVERLGELGLDAEALAVLNAPFQVARLQLADAEDSGSRADTTTALILVGTMLLGLFLGFSYVFVAITSEKTQHTTESVLSAITPQQWIDGKIVGLTLVVAVNVFSYVLGYLIYKAVAAVFLGASLGLPSAVGNPVAFVGLVLFALLGFGFWFTFFALVAATISDPNTSGRSTLMFLPLLPNGLILIGMDEPDALWMRLASLLPGTSQTAMSVRLLRGDPSAIEIVVSLALLALMVAVFRRLAGRVFGISMLMTGKEPSWREVWRWLRET